MCGIKYINIFMSVSLDRIKFKKLAPQHPQNLKG